LGRHPPAGTNRVAIREPAAARDKWDGLPSPSIEINEAQHHRHTNLSLIHASKSHSIN
jgi:hypothetical protein